MKQKPWWGYTAREMTRVVRTQLAEDGTSGGGGVQIGAPVSPVASACRVCIGLLNGDFRNRDGGATIAVFQRNAAIRRRAAHLNPHAKAPWIQAGGAISAYVAYWSSVNFERIVEQWNSNVAEIGNEKGGSGTLRNLRLIGGGLEFGSALVTPASSGTRYLCISTAGVVTSSSTACSGT